MSEGGLELPKNLYPWKILLKTKDFSKKYSVH